MKHLALRKWLAPATQLSFEKLTGYSYPKVNIFIEVVNPTRLLYDHVEIKQKLKTVTR